MIRQVLLAAAAVLVLAAGSTKARAQIETYKLDNPHTQIIFAVSHLGFSMSYGKFLDYDGEITLNRGEPSKSSAHVTIKTGSIDMGMEKWNAHMKNEDFFHVEKYPEMTFKSTSIEVTGEDTAIMTGDLTLLGVTKPVTLHVTHRKSGKHPMKDVYAAGFTAEGTLKRSDFGMDYGLPAVGDEVKLIIEAEAYREDPAQQGTNNP